MREYIAMPTRLKFLLCAVSMPFVLSAQAAFPEFRVTTMLEYGPLGCVTDCGHRRGH